MSDKLAVQFYVVIGGRTYRNGAEPGEPGQPTLLEIEHRDNEATRLQLTVKDFLYSDAPFVEFNEIPNPKCNPEIKVEAWAGWEEESLVKVFEGLLAAKRPKSQLSETSFLAIHDAFKLRKRARVKTFTGMTVADLLKKLAAQEGCVLQIDSSVAGDDALNTPTEIFFQGISGVAVNWGLMYQYVHELGYITNTIKSNVIVLRAQKDIGGFGFKRGDEWIKSIELRQEQKRGDTRSPSRKGHAHDTKPGKFWHKRLGRDCGEGKHVRAVRPSLAKTKEHHRTPFAGFSVKGTARRLEREGDELTLEIRMRPEMRNEEVITLSDFGAQIDGAWDTASVVHRMGNVAASTHIAAWRP